MQNFSKSTSDLAPNRDKSVMVDQLHLLADLSQSFSQSLKLSATLKNAVEKISDYMEVKAAAIYFVNEQQSELTCKVSTDSLGLCGKRLAVNEGVLGKTVTQARCQFSRDLSSDPFFRANIHFNLPLSAFATLCTPITMGKRVLGVLQVIDTEDSSEFGESDMEILRLLASLTAFAINNAHMAESLIEQERIHKELVTARRIQKTLLPVRKKPPFPVLAVNIPAREISGDFYDYFRLSDGRIGFTIGDVAGKGLDASLLMVRTSSLMRWAGKDGLAPNQWLMRVNDELLETLTEGSFVCALAGYYDPYDDSIVWASAGFPPVLIKRSAVEHFEVVRAHAPPLGIQTIVHIDEYHDHLAESSFYFYSDGVLDVRNEMGETQGIEGIKKMIIQSVEEPPQRRLGAIVSQLRHMTLADDTTLLLLENRDRWVLEQLVEFGFYAKPDNLKMVRDVIEECCVRVGASATEVQQLLLGINEACANVIQHGYQNDPTGKIVLSVFYKAGELIFHLKDYAECIDSDCIRPRDLNECRPGGLGVNLIDSVMDSWEFVGEKHYQGNLLVMKKILSGE